MNSQLEELIRIAVAAVAGASKFLQTILTPKLYILHVLRSFL